MYLLYWVQKTALPNWYSQYTTGNLSSSIGMNLKTLNGLFGMLENSQVNANGPSFMQAFNQSMQLFQMSSIVPQLIDMSGNVTDLDSIVKECLYNFWLQNKDSTDPAMQEQLANAMELYNQDEIRKNFVMTFANAQRLIGSLGTWANIASRYSDVLNQSAWYTKLSNAAGKASIMVTAISVGILVLPILKGGFQNMSAAEKTQWAL
jgi:hypothetical protein